jgi:hypothetical protein
MQCPPAADRHIVDLRQPSVTPSFVFRYTRGWMMTLAFVGALLLAPGAAVATGQQSFNVDKSGFPTLLIDSKNTPLADVISNLEERLQIKIEITSTLDRSQIVTGTFKGDLKTIMRRDLIPNAGYLEFYREGTIDRIVIIPERESKPTEPSMRTTSGFDTPPVDDLDKPSEKPARASDGKPASDANSAPAASAWADRVSSTLQAQIDIQRNNPDTATSAPSKTQWQKPSASMAAMTRTASDNVHALTQALRSVCIGSGCAR